MSYEKVKQAKNVSIGTKKAVRMVELGRAAVQFHEPVYLLHGREVLSIFGRLSTDSDLHNRPTAGQIPFSISLVLGPC